MTVAHEAPPSDKQGNKIPIQNSPETFLKPFLQLVPDQREWPLESALPKRRALDDAELALVREKLNGPTEVQGRVVLALILEQLGTLPREADTEHTGDRQALMLLIDKADTEYRKTMFKENDRRALVLDFDKFRTLVDITEGYESDPLFVSILRAANYAPLKPYQREILDADRIARIMQLLTTSDSDNLETILQNFGVDGNLSTNS